MERANRLQSALGLRVAEHVHGDAPADVLGGADAIDRLLHLAVSAVASFDRVGGRRQQGIVQERQGLFQRGREELLERLADRLEAADFLAEFGQLGQGRVGPATAVEQAVCLVHYLPQDAKFGMPTRDPTQVFSFRRRQVMLDKQVAVVEQAGDPGLDAFLAGRQSAPGCRRPAPTELGQSSFQLSPHLRHRLQDGLVDLGNDVELANLMRDRPQHLCDGCGIQLRAVGGDALEAQAAGRQGAAEPQEEFRDVFLGGVVVEYLVDQTFEAMIVDDRQDAIRPVVEFIGRDVTREVR